MSDFHVSIPELDAFVRRHREAPRIITEELGKAGKRSGFIVERLAKAAARVWRGHLRRSVTTKTTVSPLFVTTTVGSNLPYARARDQGRSAGSTPPPTAPIAAWLASKGGDPKLAFVVARAIGRRGIPGDRFLTGSFEKAKPQIRAEFGKVPRAVIARLRGSA